MERLQQLIGKLNEQSEQNDSPMQMLMTLRLIESELTRLHTVSATGKRNPSVAVVMPSVNITHSVAILFEEDPLVETLPVKGLDIKPAASYDLGASSQPWNTDPLLEIPTLSHQVKNRELNDIMGSNEASINDRMKSSGSELGAVLNISPIKELKKAIGVNDRFVYINELFRGDEPMYERSIKTINNFRILPEAQYWMERELKIKLGWDDSRPITQQFYQVVKRRFS
jgi:hypothetical protein